MSARLILLVLGALALLGVALAATGVPIGQALGTIVQGSFGNERALTGTLREMTPLLLAGLAVFLALQAGLFNIGVEGQFLVGGLACSATAIAVPAAGLPLGLVAGMVAGAVWALPAGWIKAYRGGHEVISTIMLNNVAGLMGAALVSGPLKAPGQESATTAMVAASARIPNLIDGERLKINLALLVGIVLVFGLDRWLKKSVAGYELRATGANPTAARAAGVDVPRVILLAMMASGAIAGAAGAVMVLAFEGRFYQGFSAGYGFDGLGVALLAAGQAWGLIPSALLFGMLNKGGTAIQILGVPKGITYVLLGLLILIVAAVRYRKEASNGD
jgi:simple sugar transport system permease protein